MNSPADDVATILASASCGTRAATSGWCLSVNQETETPNTMVTIYDYAGGRPDPKWLHDFPRVQVRTRGTSHTNAYAQAEKCKQALHGYTNQTVGSTLYVSILCIADVTFLQRDAAGRTIFVASFDIVRSPSTGTYRH